MAKACRILSRGDDKCKDSEHLGRLTMNLMQGYEKDTGAIGLDDLEGWSLEAVTFLSDTTSAVSIRELVEVGFPIEYHHQTDEGSMNFSERWHVTSGSWQTCAERCSWRQLSYVKLQVFSVHSTILHLVGFRSRFLGRSDL